MATDHNKKLPKDAWSSGVIQPKYGWVYGSADNLGGHSFVYRNINEPKKASSQTLTPSGGYETTEFDDDRKEIKAVLHVGEMRQYTGGGYSTHITGSLDQSSDSTMRTTVTGDIGVQGGKNMFSAVAENKLEGSKNAFNYTVGASESKNFSTSRGDTVHDHSGSDHKNIDGDVVHSVKGSKVTIIQTGDYAIQVLGGNIDRQIAQKLREYAGGDILIESAESITFKVGGTAITLGGAGMTFNTDTPIQINTSSHINMTAGEPINLQGSQTNIQGGGMIAPPTTFR